MDQEMTVDQETTLTTWTVKCGDAVSVLRAMPENSVHCVVTSPPYWGLRDYGVEGQIGQEPTPDAYVETMVDVFREVRRVLHESGTVWLNVGDSYAGANNGYSGDDRPSNSADQIAARSNFNNPGKQSERGGGQVRRMSEGLKTKDLCLIPWRLALALQADGWWVRSVICWAKKSCMPESVTDRPTNSWEPIFLLAKSARYFYDAEAVKEPSKCDRMRGPAKDRCPDNNGNDGLSRRPLQGTSNQRNVWHLGPEPYAEAHFATFPSEIPFRAIRAGTSEHGCCPTCAAPWERITLGVGTRRQGVPRNQANRDIAQEPKKKGAVGTPTTTTLGWEPTCHCGGEPVPCTVLDPFAGSGTTGAVAARIGRNFVGIELNPNYVQLARKRIGRAAPLLSVER